MAARPRVVAIGGGHGLSASLAAARRYAGDLTAVVTVADDGGSSGRLRAAFGIPAPGDLRRCLVALGDPSSPWAAAFEHRFGAGELEGHALGNVMMAGLIEQTGSLMRALDLMAGILGVTGRVLPATTVPVVLMASAGTVQVEGQLAVQNTAGITRVCLVPEDPEPPADAVAAVAAADQVVIGPGSLFTSVLAVVAVPRLRAAMAATAARRVYVCNLMPERETDGYGVADHVHALIDHGLVPDVVVCHPGALPAVDVPVPCVEAPVAVPGSSVHDPALLGGVLAGLAGRR
jgi:uncharacterized cofD-like protein